MRGRRYCYTSPHRRITYLQTKAACQSTKMVEYPQWDHFSVEVDQLGDDYDKFDWDLFYTGFIEPFKGSGAQEGLPSMSSVYPPSFGMTFSMSSAEEVIVDTGDTRTLDKEASNDACLTKRGRGRPKLQLGKGETAAEVSLISVIHRFQYFEKGGKRTSKISEELFCLKITTR
jgi:hypothetical protein